MALCLVALAGDSLVVGGATRLLRVDMLAAGTSPQKILHSLMWAGLRDGSE